VPRRSRHLNRDGVLRARRMRVFLFFSGGIVARRRYWRGPCRPRQGFPVVTFFNCSSYADAGSDVIFFRDAAFKSVSAPHECCTKSSNCRAPLGVGAAYEARACKRCRRAAQGRPLRSLDLAGGPAALARYARRMAAPRRRSARAQSVKARNREGASSRAIKRLEILRDLRELACATLPATEKAGSLEQGGSSSARVGHGCGIRRG